MTGQAHQYSRLGPDDTLVVKFTRRMDGKEVREWLDRLTRAYPDRKVIVVDKDTEFRIEQKSVRSPRRLIAAAILVLIVDIVLRAAL